MSLAASGGLGGMGGAGAGAGGLVMAHQANAMARPTAPNPPPGADIPLGAGGPAPPTSAAAALGADLVDKQQQISLRQVRDLSTLPVVALDLYSSEPTVASFPPKSKDPASDPGSPALVGKMKDYISLKATEASHKTFRKWLSKSKGYEDLQADCFAKPDDVANNSVVTISNPKCFLGLRRLDDAPDYIKTNIDHEDDSDSPAIAEESSPGVGVTLANGTLDGSVPQGDDYDRVVCKIRLHQSKKALTVLPEEVLQLVLNQAQYHVSRKNVHKSDDEDGEEIMSYPCAVSVPSPYCHDGAIEALLDATGGTGVVFQRSVAAMAGALLPSAEQGKPNTLIDHFNRVLSKKAKEFQREQVNNPEAQFEEKLIILLTGTTKDTVESTAIELSVPQRDSHSCIYGNFKVLCTVAHRHEKPESIIGKCISELFDSLDAVAPEADGPVAMVSYGTSDEQKKVQSKWEKVQKSLEDWEEVPHFFTKVECVALGTAVLGAVSHGRISTIVQVPGKKAKAQLAIQVQNVAPVAVGVMTNYHGGAKDKWTEVKTIFDFDRRVPAGPYQIELTAAEAAVHREMSTKDMSDDELLKAIKKNEGSGRIPKREAAALDLRVQVLQKWTRNGEWKKVGDAMSPLVIVNKDEEKIACEKVVLELSLGSTGLITNSLIGDRESVVQATKTARNSMIRWYLGILFAILFFGGFLFKSWWEERVFDRDTRRLLAYYKHVIPGSLADGDLHNARYLVWKYRGKKEKLWKSLEKKYGYAVLHENEWIEEEEDKDKKDEDDEEMENLDEEEEKEKAEEEESASSHSEQDL